MPQLQLTLKEQYQRGMITWEQYQSKTGIIGPEPAYRSLSDKVNRVASSIVTTPFKKVGEFVKGIGSGIERILILTLIVAFFGLLLFSFAKKQIGA